jgi:hypothetical protein
LVDLYNDAVDLYLRVKVMPKAQITSHKALIDNEIKTLRARWKLIEYVLNAIFWLNYANLDERDYTRIKTQLLNYPIYEAWELSSTLSQIDFLFDEIERVLVVLEVLKITIRKGGYEFNSYLREDWGFRVYEDFPQYWTASRGTPDKTNIEYAYKMRAMFLVAMISGKHISMFPSRWKNYTVDELRIREAEGIPPSSYTRRLIYDYGSQINVVTESISGGRWKGYIDFSVFSSDVPLKLDLSGIETIMKGYRHKTEMVSDNYD